MIELNELTAVVKVTFSAIVHVAVPVSNEDVAGVALDWIQQLEPGEALDEIEVIEFRDNDGVLIASAVPSAWTEDKQFPRDDWKYEVANDDTSRGYWDWVKEKRQ